MFFADGHYRFVAQDIAYSTYRQLMTPNSVASDVNHGYLQVSGGSYSGNATPVLDEASY